MQIDYDYSIYILLRQDNYFEYWIYSIRIEYNKTNNSAYSFIFVAYIKEIGQTYDFINFFIFSFYT